MKYLFINAVAGNGSTGRIAAEQCRALMAQGHECLLAYGRDTSGCPDVPTVRIGSELEVRLHALQTRVLDNTGFGSKAATRRFLERVREYNPDVIWLHNLHGYYIHLGLLFDYLHSCGKEIHWMLHDCWAFTGHCPHFDFIQCDLWKTGCHDCPQKGRYPASRFRDNSRNNFLEKRRLFTGIPNLTLAVPSQWLASRVRESFLKDYPVEVIPNTVDTGIFKPTPGTFREKYGLENKRIVLGVANVWDDRKGLFDFFALAPLLDERFQIVLIGLSPKQIRSLPREILGLPRTRNVQELVEAYTAADVFVNPSVEETFGMTSLEAACCGTPAIVYRDTACEEAASYYGGIAVDRGAENLYRAILEIAGEGRK